MADAARLDDCLRWGDDYELLFTAPADADLPVAAHAIGVVNTRADTPLILGQTPLTNPQNLGYNHG